MNTDIKVIEPQKNEETVAEQQFTWRPQDADREYIKMTTRQRVQNAKVHPNAIFRPAKPAPTINDSDHKRVAVYARVSTKSTDQVSSIENQTKYYTDKIEKTPNWELQDIYKDEGISGTSTKRRKDFQRMIQAADDKKIDLIVCASVSRFARDISDMIENVRHLKTHNPNHPVGVYFETEDIYTLDPNIMERLQMHALFSEWESRNKSRRMILSYDQRICTGQYPVLDLLGYRHTPEGDLIIHKEEAKTVRFIFLAYMCGYSVDDIAEILTEKARPTRHGKTVWTSGMVKAIMYNERRWGDLEARKRIVIDYKERKTIKNDFIRDSAFIPGHHEGIVTPAIAKAVHLLAQSARGYRHGVPDFNVIRDGGLKGFVSVSPLWGGMDTDTLRTISASVYADDEIEEIEKEARILSGEEHSKILSMSFTGYEVPYSAMLITQSTPQLTLSMKSMALNKVAHKRLNNSQYVEVLYHPILEMLAIKSCNADTPNAIEWSDDKPLKLTTVAFSKAIYEKMKWIKEYRFKFRGISRSRDNESALFFYLDEPQILVGKRMKKFAEQDGESSLHFIPHKEGGEEMNELTYGKAYPSMLQNNYGISYELRKRRGRLLDTVSGTDLSIKGIIVENPLIGTIPTQSEVRAEVEQLLMSM